MYYYNPHFTDEPTNINRKRLSNLNHEMNKGRGKCSAHSQASQSVPGAVLLGAFPILVSIIQEHSFTNHVSAI